MSFNKLYPDLDINSLPKVSKEKHLSSALNKLLDTEVCNYSISVIWNSGLDCNILYMAGKVDTSTKWHNIITTSQGDNDGEMSFELGNFTIGRTVSISLGLFAATAAIPRVAVLIKNQTNGKVFKFPAGDDYKNIDVAVPLPLTFEVVLP